MTDTEISPTNGPGGLADLTTALALYLEEINDDYHTCLRHEGTTAVAEECRGLRLTRHFHRTRAAGAYLQKAIARLPSWRQSPFRDSDGERWDALERDAAASAHASGVAGGGFVVRGIAWHGRPILVGVRSAGVKKLVALDLLLPHVTRDLPELPLRRVADGLRCHAHLLPERVAVALPLPDVEQPGPDTVRTYLVRATPQGLYAGQCFSRRRAGQ